MKKYDVIVIGTGSNNIVLDKALKQGLQCAQIEKSLFGGTCLTRGCIPTKVLATTADYIREINEVSKIGVAAAPASMNWDIVSERVWKKINEHREVLAYYQAAPNLDIYQGTGYFTRDKVIKVSLSDGTESEEITADKIFIAVGARSNIPNIDGLSAAGYIASESLFGDKYPKKPYKSLIILGGGPIGTEFAHVFAAAGTKVTILQRGDRLLTKEDEEISEQLLKNFTMLGIDVLLNAAPTFVRTENNQKVVAFADSTGKTTEVQAEEIMIASGILSNTDTLHLHNTSIELDKNGWIVTNEFLETSAEGVWAFGDVNGKAPFRHKANYEAEIVAHNLFDAHPPTDWRWARYDVVPAVTFTYPQIAHVGLTEKEALKAGYSVATAKHHYSSTAKGYALGFNPGDEQDGFVKVIVNKQNNTLLGIHIIGPQASILLQPFVNLMNAGETKLIPINPHIASPTVKELRTKKLTRNLHPHSVTSIVETMTPHPSLSEVIMWMQYYFK